MRAACAVYGGGLWALNYQVFEIFQRLNCAWPKRSGGSLRNLYNRRSGLPGVAAPGDGGASAGEGAGVVPAPKPLKRTELRLGELLVPYLRGCAEAALGGPGDGGAPASTALDAADWRAGRSAWGNGWGGWGRVFSLSLSRSCPYLVVEEHLRFSVGIFI